MRPSVLQEWSVLYHINSIFIALKKIMILLMFADKEPEASTVKKTTTTVEPTTSTVASTITTNSTTIMSNPPKRIVINGLLINLRENQRST